MRGWGSCGVNQPAYLQPTFVQPATMQMESSADPAIIHAPARNGLSLPVIDLTNPQFAVPDDKASLEALQIRYLDEHRRMQNASKFITQLLMRLAARRSLLMRALFHSDSGVLDSITTYIMKLGERHLPSGFDGSIDRKIAASPYVPLLRLRMQQIAKACANALVRPLRGNATAPLHLVNIAGGPALDSINVLIFLRRDHGELLQRPICIHVLDSHDDGPAFGANALAALKREGAPLHGLDADLRYQAYDWTQTQSLQQLLKDLAAGGAVIAASSEGGLFEYGDDESIVANLKALREAGVNIVAGSVTNSSELRKQTIAASAFKLIPRGLDGFEPLARRAGYAIAASKTALISEQVLLQLC